MTDADMRCALRASTQYGLITRRQALEEGLSERQVDHRLAKGFWRVIHPGIYSVGGAPSSWHQDLLAAALWAGGVASHRSAATLWELPGFKIRPDSLIDVTVTHCHLPPRCGIRVHHTQRLLATDRREIDCIPVTAIERTLMDLGAVTHRHRVAAALDSALARGLTTPERIDEYLRLVARRGRRGTRTLRNLIRERSEMAAIPESPLESKFFELLVEEGLPTPQLQYKIFNGDRLVARVDFAWPEQKVILEMDGYKYHSGHGQWEKDRARRNELTLMGWQVLHGTWRDAHSMPRQLLGRIAAALSQSFSADPHDR